jgi:NitT/TauT family transport system substrate-binding protein
MSKKLSRWALACVLLSALSLLLAACGSSSSGATTTAGTVAIPSKPESGTITMTTQPWIGYGMWIVAQKQGFFAKQGINVESTNFGENATNDAALEQGKFDAANLPTNIATRLIAAGVPLTAVLLMDHSVSADAVLAGPGITSIKQLKGKSVSYEVGSTSDQLIRHALQVNGMSLNDIHAVHSTAAAAADALIAGKVAAAVTYQPYITTATKNDKSLHVIYDSGQAPGLITDVFMVKTSFLKSKPGQVAALLRSWQEAIDFYNSNHTKAESIIATAFGTPLASLAPSFAGVTLYSLRGALEQLEGPFPKETEAAESADVSAGELPHTVAPSQFIDTQFLKAAGG